MDEVLLAVNGGLMRGLDAHHVMTDADARFVRDDVTAPEYRMWSIDDVHPAMMRFRNGGAAMAVEVYALTPAGFAAVFAREPRGLSIAHVAMADGTTMFGVVGEPILCEGRHEITAYGGWRAYLESREAQ